MYSKAVWPLVGLRSSRERPVVLRSTGRYDDLDAVMSNEATRALRRVSSRVDGDARVEGVHRVCTDQDHTRRYRITPGSVVVHA